MYTTVAGVYRNGRVELLEIPRDIEDEAPVIITFLKANEIDLHARGIDESQAAELLGRLFPFAEDWNAPEMDIYDNFDAAKPAG